jgi:PPOX class probable F420-dependent enzyme
MSLSDKDREFVEHHRAAVMVTLKTDGTPHVARVGVGLVEGKLWSSGTQDRIRTKHLRRDPRCTLFVFDEGHAYRWLGLETTVAILDGPDAPQKNLALYRALAGEPDDVEEYLRAMVVERRLVYEFDVTRTYGMR